MTRALLHRVERPATDKADSQGTREKLLNAAAEVFAETGYDGAAVREICARAGTNIALVNYYFGDKLGLYTEVLQQSVRSSHVDAIQGALEQERHPGGNSAGRSSGQRVRGIGAGGLANQQLRIVIHELGRPTPAIARVVKNIARPVYERVLTLIGEIIGLAPDDEKTRLCAHSVMGQIMLYALARPFLTRLWPELKMTPDQLDRIADHIADFSLAYLHDAKASNQAARGKDEKVGEMMQQETKESNPRIDQIPRPAAAARSRSGGLLPRIAGSSWLVLALIVAVCGYFVWRLFFATPSLPDEHHCVEWPHRRRRFHHFAESEWTNRRNSVSGGRQRQSRRHHRAS